MTGTNADVFVDTNVLVYARDIADQSKQLKAAGWMAALWRSARGRTSVQVLNEYYSTVTRKLKPGLDATVARRDVEHIMLWDPVDISTAVVRRAWRLQDRHSLSFWDALIVSAAQIAGCRSLLTEDLQEGQDFGGVVVVSPFLHEPSDILSSASF